jgi:thioredoxin-dependent peroxiredoxin
VPLVRYFDAEASKLENTVVLCILKDLSIEQKRFCEAEGFYDVNNLSDFRDGQFRKDFGVEIFDGPLAGLESRAVVVFNEEGTLIYTQQVNEIVDVPNYDLALSV